MSQNPSGSNIAEAISTAHVELPRVGFIGIGAQKCASTWLHDVLEEHPELAMPVDCKEVDYFSYHYESGRRWYEQQFTANDAVCGEISPSYLHSPGVVDRVAAYNPAMRIILIIRDPIERAISNHKHEVRIGHIQGPDLSFESGLRNNPAYVEQGLYAKHLENWLSKFPAEQILVMKFEEVLENPETSLVKVCAFLDIDTGYQSPLLHTKSNPSYLNRSAGLEKAKNTFRSAIRSLGLGGVWERLGNAGLRKHYRKFNHVEPATKIAAPLPETIELLQAVFGPDLEKLERMTGLSTADWLQQ